MKTQWKRKRVARKPKAKRPRNAISSANKGVSFVRTFFATNWAFDTASTFGFYRKFAPAFSSIPNYAEYQALFDEFKINKIKVSFHPRFGEVVSSVAWTTNTNNQYYLTYAPDPKTDPGALTGTYSANTYNGFLEENQRVKTKTLNKPVSITYVPRIKAETAIGSSSMVKGGWMSLEGAINEPHFGLIAFMHDYAFQAANASFAGCDIQITIYFACRGVN